MSCPECGATDQHHEECMHSPVGHLGYVLAELDNLRTVVLDQAEDDGLWIQAETAPEAYLQAELRRLHRVIEGIEA